MNCPGQSAWSLLANVAFSLIVPVVLSTVLSMKLSWPVALTPAFQLIRALAIEAFYSDFVAPGAQGPSAYEEIDFHSPLAMRIKKDWSYLGVVG